MVIEEQGQQPTEAAFRRAGGPMLARLLLALIEGREPLGPALGCLGSGVLQGTGGPRTCALLAKWLLRIWLLRVFRASDF